MRRKWFRSAAVAACWLAGCEALYGGYAVDNSSNCMVNTALCQVPEQACNPQTRECEPAIVLDSVDPPAAPTVGGDILTLGGQRFSPDLRVRIGGVDVASVTFVSDRSLSVAAPASPGQRGPVTVEIIHPAGQTVRRDGLFRYYEQTQLTTPQPVALAFGPRHLRSADVNRDGRLDVVMSDGFDPMIYTLLAQADGSLAEPIATTMSARPFGLALGDVNGDGKPDVAISRTGPGTAIEVALGGGDGSFASSAVIGTQTTLGGLALGDVNSDGLADLVALDALRLRVWLSNGDGTFAATSRDFALAYQSFGVSGRVALADLNGDAALDLVATNGTDLSFPIFFGDGQGSFSEVPSPVFAAPPTAFAVGDTNGDGLLDVVASLGSAEPSTALMLQTAGRSFRQPILLAGPRSANGVEILDMNRDSVSDVVLFSPVVGTGVLSIQHAISPTRYAAPKSYSLPPYPLVMLAWQRDKTQPPSLLVVHRGAGASGNFYSILSNVTP